MSDSVYEIQLQAALELQQHTLKLTLLPDSWNALCLPQPLSWSKVKFSADSVLDVPDNLVGVYSFVIEPDVANCDLAYLLYIGMTKEQNFRIRYRQYLRHQNEEKTKRPLVRHMLRTWPEHLWFYYAPIENEENVLDTEEKLLNALKPPIPRKYTGAVKDAISLQRLW